MRKRTAATVVCAAAIGICAIGSTSASAATERIGSALNLSYDGGVCFNDCLSVQLAQAGGNLPHPLTSPVNGVITEWKVRTGDPGALYHLRVLTPAAGNAYIATTTNTAPSPVPEGVVDSILTYFPLTTVPISQGQAIGVLQTIGTGAGADVGLPQHNTNGVPSNVINNIFSGAFLDGLGAAAIPDQQHELLLQATVRFCRVPDVVGQTQAAAIQALAAAECGSSVRKKGTRKKKKRGKVLSQGTAAGSTVPPFTPVEIVVGKKKKGKKKK